MPRTEGLFSSELDLRELQKTGKLGRIEITVNTQGNRSYGKIIIPTNLDKFATALVAAMVESVDRVGPYHAKVTIERIEDARVEKKKKIIDRARSILYEWERKKIPVEEEVLKELEDAIVKAKVVEYGDEGLPAGPEVNLSDELIVVEGRADVINLLRHGYKNVIAVEGVKVPRTVQELTRRKKKVIAFLDGDRGGDMILKELADSCRLHLVARAPQGKEVEGLTSKEIAESLQQALPVDEAIAKLKPFKYEPSVALPEEVAKIAGEVEGSLMAVALDEELNELGRFPVSELIQKVQDMKEMRYLVFDGVVTQRLVEAAASSGGQVYLIGVRVGEISAKPANVKVFTFEDISDRIAS